MPNIRILYDNAADDATLTASTTSGSLAASNLLTSTKTDVWRSTSTTATLTLKFPAGAGPKVFNMAALAFANLTSTATMRCRVYASTSDVAGTSTALLDSGTALCCRYKPFGDFDWGYEAIGGNAYPPPSLLGVNLFPYGGFSYGRSYFTATSGRQLVIDIVDSNNPAGYIEVGRLIAGAYWSPTVINATGSASVDTKEFTQRRRTDSGDLKTERRPKGRTVRVELGAITTALERNRAWDILRNSGQSSPVFVSVYPEHADPVLEQSNQLWGSLGDSTLSNPSYGIYAAPLELQEA